MDDRDHLEGELEGELREVEREIRADEERLHADEDREGELEREINEERALHIVVNGREKTLHQRVLTFDEVVALAFDPPPSAETKTITVTYWHRGGKPEGSLTDGQSVEIIDGLVFNVTATDKS